METWGKAMARIRGEVNADFLPITSDRTGFIKDSPQYEAFQKVMGKIMADVKIVLQRLTGKKESRKVSRALKEALHRIYKALALNPDLSPFGALPVGEETKGIGGAAMITKPTEKEVETVQTVQSVQAEKPKKKKKPKVRQLTPNAVIKKMRFGEVGVSCCKDPKNPRQAFERQSKLLRDAFIERAD